MAVAVVVVTKGVEKEEEVVVNVYLLENLLRVCREMIVGKEWWRL